MNEDDELNKMFREGLNEPGHHAEYREADWDALEQMLDGAQKKRGIILWWPVASGIAAMLLLFLGWMFLKPAVTEKNKPAIAVNKTSAGGTVGNGAAQQPVETRQQVAANTNTSPQNVAGAASEHPKTNNVQSAQAKSDNQSATPAMAGNKAVIAINKHPRKGKKNTTPVDKNEPQTMIAANKPDKANTETTTATDKPEKNGNEAVVAANKPEQNNTATAFSPQTFVISKPETVKGAANADTAAKAKPQIAKQMPKTVVKTASVSSGTHFALTVLAASNVNGVGSFQQGQMGANVGLTFSAGYKRFTLTSGAIYAKAPYATDFSNYHIKYQFAVNPTTVNADCRVLDIPINLDYRVYGNFKNKLSIGTGLSSYLMLKEDYTYTYATYPTGYYAPDGYSITNRNQHYLGVLNFDVLYQHRLNAKFSLDVQPYLKLPLTDIGYGHVQLQTAGVAVGLSWNIK